MLSENGLEEGKRRLPSAEPVLPGLFRDGHFGFSASLAHTVLMRHNAKRGNGEKYQPTEPPVSRLMRLFGRGLERIVTEVACFPRVKPFLLNSNGPASHGRAMLHSPRPTLFPPLSLPR